MIILLGAPGSGKGTQTEKLSDYFNIPAICMGDIIRAQIKEKTTLGSKMKAFLDIGDLVPDSIINAMYEENKPELVHPYGAILDGFPRTINQAKYLNDLYSKSQITLQVVLIDVPDTILTDRLLERKRSDDTTSIIQNRLVNYQREIEPILSFYKSKAININGIGSIEDVFNRICNAIKK
ncbi:adenylate kinase [Candidatus Marinamargulisbacteria bacterium SCGC AG-333-B06]|nr:adenylate kinase [Candidatus Marinamargulisbacteria bacterium SCGC AG-333-B06]